MARRLEIGRIVRSNMTDGPHPAKGSFGRVFRHDPDEADFYMVQFAVDTRTNDGDVFTGWVKGFDETPLRFWWCCSPEAITSTRLCITDGRTFASKFRGDRIVGQSLGRVAV